MSIQTRIQSEHTKTASVQYITTTIWANLFWTFVWVKRDLVLRCSNRDTQHVNICGEHWVGVVCSYLPPQNMQQFTGNATDFFPLWVCEWRKCKHSLCKCLSGRLYEVQSQSDVVGVITLCLTLWVHFPQVQMSQLICPGYSLLCVLGKCATLCRWCVTICERVQLITCQISLLFRISDVPEQI